jgi:hypothetical protein
MHWQWNNFGCIQLQGKLDTVLESRQRALFNDVSSSPCKCIHRKLLEVKNSHVKFEVSCVASNNFGCIHLQGELAAPLKRARLGLS